MCSSIFSRVPLVKSHQTTSVDLFHIFAVVRVDPQQSNRLRTSALQALGDVTLNVNSVNMQPIQLNTPRFSYVVCFQPSRRSRRPRTNTTACHLRKDPPVEPVHQVAASLRSRDTHHECPHPWERLHVQTLQLSHRVWRFLDVLLFAGRCPRLTVQPQTHLKLSRWPFRKLVWLSSSRTSHGHVVFARQYLLSPSARSRVTHNSSVAHERVVHAIHPSVAPSHLTSPLHTQNFRLSGFTRASGVIGRSKSLSPRKHGTSRKHCSWPF